MENLKSRVLKREMYNNKDTIIVKNPMVTKGENLLRVFVPFFRDKLQPDFTPSILKPVTIWLKETILQ